MMSPAQFRRWVMPALEEEAALVRHHVYHWDGPGALVHTDALVASPAIHTLSYVPGEGRGTCADYVDLYQRVQAGGKAVQVWGSVDVDQAGAPADPAREGLLLLQRRQPGRGRTPARRGS